MIYVMYLHWSCQTHSCTLHYHFVCVKDKNLNNVGSKKRLLYWGGMKKGVGRRMVSKVQPCIRAF